MSGPGTRPDPRSGRRRRGCPVTGVSAGSQSWHPPALPVWSAWPVQEAGVHGSDG